eukprot:4445165-Pyramimonas_sp.AAC.1
MFHAEFGRCVRVAQGGEEGAVFDEDEVLYSETHESQVSALAHTHCFVLKIPLAEVPLVHQHLVYRPEAVRGAEG